MPKIMRCVARASDGEDVALVMSGDPPQFKDLALAEKFYEREANIVEETLQHLPGGVYDRVLGLMMERRASLLRVRHQFPEESNGTA